MTVNVFYSTFTNVFILVRFWRFLNVFLFWGNVFVHLWLTDVVCGDDVVNSPGGDQRRQCDRADVTHRLHSQRSDFQTVASPGSEFQTVASPRSDASGAQNYVKTILYR